MALVIDAIQQALQQDAIDGWLLYDFHGSNPIAQRLAGLTGRHVTRRWFYFIPASGTPRKLVHAIESGVLDALPGDRHLYAGRVALESGLPALLTGAKIIAMEYSPRCAIPYLARVDAGTIELVTSCGVQVVTNSRVDAGTIELVTSCGVQVVPSGDLVGRFAAAWDEAAVDSHRQASHALYRIKDHAFAYIGARLDAREPVHELEVQARMLQWFAEEGLTADAPPIVAAGEHSADPHYAPDRHTSRIVAPGDLVLIDLWGKLPHPQAVYADITWTGVAGRPAPEHERIFGLVAAARDAALACVQQALQAGTDVYGWQVDRAARTVITAAGYGEQFVHRTGHSLGVEVHGDGVHMDDYETHDDRRVLPGTGFTIEPGIYLSRFGVRSEINVVAGSHTAEATGPIQQALVRIGRPAAPWWPGRPRR